MLQFYLPHPGGLASLPRTSAEYWPWICRNRQLGEGRYSWTLQTWLQLREGGVPCELVSSFPSRGIVVSHRDFLPLFLRPRAGVFLVCIKPDRKAHTWSHYYIVQNRSDSIFASVGESRARVLPFWPQPSLLPRDPARGTTCENAAYFGRLVNLAPELKEPAFGDAVGGLGMCWDTVPLEKWNDYSQVDVAVSARGFGAGAVNVDPVLNPDSKPPSKLINSWLAGVPAVVGHESSFRNIRRSPLDYIEVDSREELLAALARLRSTPSLYRDMIEHGRERAREHSAASVVGLWKDTIGTGIEPEYARWMARGGFARFSDNAARVLRFVANWRNLAAIRLNG